MTHLTLTTQASRRAFTLIELIVASILIAALVGATYQAVSQTMRSRERSESRGEAFGRASLAADLIAHELQSALRARELNEGRIAIVRTGSSGKGQDGLLLFTHITRPIRSGTEQAEGDECESQFRLEPSARSGQYVLWHRRAAVPDEYADAGGVATAMVDGITGLSIDAYDGAAWRDTWDSDSDGYPHAVRLVITATDDRTTNKTTATARRVVAFDRTPIPLPTTDSSTPSTSSSTTSR